MLWAARQAEAVAVAVELGAHAGPLPQNTGAGDGRSARADGIAGARLGTASLSE